MSKPQLTAKLKDAISSRANECCEYCFSQARFSPDPFSIEHVVPRSKGGTDQFDNLALACQGCNNHKYTHTEALDPVSISCQIAFNRHSELALKSHQMQHYRSVGHHLFWQLIRKRSHSIS